jgi:hypothetical protein
MSAHHLVLLAQALLDLYQKHKDEYHAQRREELKVIA